ncbi:hypothetical protein D3C80_1745320 [compost metagenome]
MATFSAVLVEHLQQILANTSLLLRFITRSDVESFEKGVITVADHEGRIGHLELPVLLDAQDPPEQFRQDIADRLSGIGNAADERGIKVIHVTRGRILGVWAKLIVTAVLVVFDLVRTVVV